MLAIDKNLPSSESYINFNKSKINYLYNYILDNNLQKVFLNQLKNALTQNEFPNFLNWISKVIPDVNIIL